MKSSCFTAVPFSDTSQNIRQNASDYHPFEANTISSSPMESWPMDLLFGHSDIKNFSSKHKTFRMSAGEKNLAYVLPSEMKFCKQFLHAKCLLQITANHQITNTRWKKSAHTNRSGKEKDTPDLNNEVMLIFLPYSSTTQKDFLLEMGKHLLYSHFNTHLLNFTPLNSWENSN